MKDLLSTIANDCGLAFADYEPVSGGDINQSFCVFAERKRFFLKINDAKLYPNMFMLEADGLNALREHTNLQVPAVIQYGVAKQQQWLLLEWIERGNAHVNSIKNFGTELANTHKQPKNSYGWHTDNYIGSLQQINTQQQSWSEFYAQCRIMPLVKVLFEQGRFSKKDLVHANNFCNKLEQLFPEESPVLLHGDLWAGNYMINQKGDAAIFDPAVYCGHREMDIGMTKLFGGFDQSFYNAYNEIYPLEKNWQQRLPFSQLYPVLVHAVLFGGHYISQASEIIAVF